MGSTIKLPCIKKAKQSLEREEAKFMKKRLMDLKENKTIERIKKAFWCKHKNTRVENGWTRCLKCNKFLYSANYETRPRTYLDKDSVNTINPPSGLD